MFEEFKDVLTVMELQDALRISKNYAYELLNKGEIKGLRLGNKWRIPKANLINYIIKKGA